MAARRYKLQISTPANPRYNVTRLHLSLLGPVVQNPIKVILGYYVNFDSSLMTLGNNKDFEPRAVLTFHYHWLKIYF